MNRLSFPLLLSAALTLLASPPALALTVTVGGRPVAGDAISQGGKVYVSVDALKAAGLGVSVTAGSVALTLPGTGAGGQNQLSALGGCLGETLFNGVWRLRVTDMQPATVRGKPGYELGIEVRNATAKPLSLYDSGFTTASAGSSLAVAFGDANTAASDSLYDRFKKINPAAAYTFAVKFLPDDTHAGQTPVKLLFTRDSPLGAALPYNTRAPSFRVDLTCKK